MLTYISLFILILNFTGRFLYFYLSLTTGANPVLWRAARLGHPTTTESGQGDGISALPPPSLSGTLEHVIAEPGLMGGARQGSACFHLPRFDCDGQSLAYSKPVL